MESVHQYQFVWSKDLQEIADFDFSIARRFFEGNGWTSRQKTKGYKYFAENYIHEVYCCGLSIKAKCYKSQKKNEKPHNVYINLRNNGQLDVADAFCSCEAGLLLYYVAAAAKCNDNYFRASMSCNHLVGLAFYMQDLTLRRFKTIPEDVSSTSRPMAWNVPRGPKIKPERVLGKVFYNPLTTHGKRAPIRAEIYNPIRNDILKKITPENVYDLKNKLKAEHEGIPMTYLMESYDGTSQVEILEDMIVNERSLLGLWGQSLEKEKIQPTPSTSSNPWHLDEHLPISLPILNTDTTLVLITVEPVGSDLLGEICFQEASKIEETTRKQRKCELWLTKRKLRFTASKFGLICKRKVFNAKFIELFCEPVDISHVPQIQHDIQNEKKAIELYLSTCTDVKYYKCGLVIHPYAAHLGASPDGVVYHNLWGYGVVEVKCPSGRKYSNLLEACAVKQFCLEKRNDRFSLKQDSDYFFQVQGQMLLTGLTWSHFIVYLACSNEIHIEKIGLDVNFCASMYQKLTKIYKEKFLPNVTHYL